MRQGIFPAETWVSTRIEQAIGHQIIHFDITGEITGIETHINLVE